MAVFTSLVVVTSAVVAGTTATLTAAVVVTAIAQVAVIVGTTLNVVGAVTGDKTLRQVGMGLSLAGGVTGLAAAGGLFGADVVAQEALGSASDQAFGQAVEGGTTLSGAPVGAPETLSGAATAAGAGSGGIPDVAPIVPDQSSEMINQGLDTGPARMDIDPSKVSMIDNAPGVPTAAAPDAPLAPSAPMAPVAPGSDGFLSSVPSAPEVPSNLGSLPGHVAGDLPTITPNTDMGSWWSELSPTTQAMLAMTGGQAIAGFAGGYFQGASAEQRLELEKLMNEQRQQQIQLQNRNAAYAPKLNFKTPKPGPAGLLNTAKGST